VQVLLVPAIRSSAFLTKLGAAAAIAVVPY